MRTDLSFRLLGLSVSPLRALGLAHRFGFDSLETPVEIVAALERSAVRELRDHAHALGLRWGPGHIDLELGAAKATFEARMHRLPSVATAVAQLGCEALTVDVPDLSAAGLTERTLVSRLREVAVVLGAFGIRLGLAHGIAAKPNLGARFEAGSNWTTTRWIVDALRYDHVVVVLDAWAWYVEGREPSALESLEPAEVVAVQLGDAPLGLQRRFLGPNDVRLPGSVGRVRAAAWIACLEAAGIVGPIRAMIAGPLAREAVTAQGVERFLARVARSLGPDGQSWGELGRELAEASGGRRELSGRFEPAHAYRPHEAWRPTLG